MLSAGITDKDVLRDLGFIYKKEKDMESALKCFNIASSLNCPVSMHETCIILEKYYKCYGEALNIAEKLKSYLISRPIIKKKKVATIDKRIARLKLKLNKINEVI